MKFGINLYGVLRDRQDTMRALRELKELGFGAVEPCVAPEAFPGLTHVFWPEEWLREHLAEIRETGLEIPSIHLIGWKAAAQRERLVTAVSGRWW